jgi:hypothetical protein
MGLGEGKGWVRVEVEGRVTGIRRRFANKQYNTRTVPVYMETLAKSISSITLHHSCLPGCRTSEVLTAEEEHFETFKRLEQSGAGSL